MVVVSGGKSMKALFFFLFLVCEHRAENQLNTEPMPHPKSRKLQRLPHATPIDDVQSFCPR
jgi:hypothetical protein